MRRGRDAWRETVTWGSDIAACQISDCHADEIHRPITWRKRGCRSRRDPQLSANSAESRVGGTAVTQPAPVTDTVTRPLLPLPKKNYPQPWLNPTSKRRVDAGGPESRPGVELKANLKSIPHRRYLGQRHRRMDARVCIAGSRAAEQARRGVELTHGRHPA